MFKELRYQSKRIYLFAERITSIVVIQAPTAARSRQERIGSTYQSERAKSNLTNS